jgi:hypothetical protein
MCCDVFRDDSARETALSECGREDRLKKIQEAKQRLEERQKEEDRAAVTEGQRALA